MRKSDTAVSLLLFVSGPAAIFRRVVAVVIYAVKSFVFGAFTHIRKEIAKVFPSSTNAYAASTVVPKVFVLWISSTLKHCMPTDVCAASLSYWRMAVFKSPKASARSRPSRSEFCTDGSFCLATVATTFPYCISSVRPASGNYHQFAEAFTDDGFGFVSSRHGVIV